MQRLLLFIFIALAGNLAAQQVRQVGFDDVQDRSLDQIITADLEAIISAEGEERHLIYELARSTPFIFNSTLRFDSTFHVELRAQEGDGERPLIFIAVADGETPSELFRINGPAMLTLRGLLLSGESDQGGTFTARTVRLDGENTVTVDDCYFDQTRQSMFRLSGGDEKLFVSNSIFNRVGQPDNPNNGRFIDHRGAGADSIVVRNSIVANTTSRWFRTGGGAVAEYVEMDNNTFINSGQAGFTFDEIETLVFTDNIVVNAEFRGVELVDQRDSIEDATYVFEIDTLDLANDQVIFARNNFFESPELAGLLPAVDGTMDSIVTLGAFDRYYDANIQAAIAASGEGDSNFSEVLEFEEPPLLDGTLITILAQDTTGGQDLPNDTPDFDLSNLDEVELYSGTNLGSAEPVARYTDFYNLCYDAGTTSATASATGDAIGGQDSEACEGLTRVENLVQQWEASVFPNPTTGLLELRLPTNEGELDASLFNATGQLISRRRISGQRGHFDLSQRPAGTYFLRLRNDAGQNAVRTIVKH
jgi:hypothetical protein